MEFLAGGSVLDLVRSNLPTHLHTALKHTRKHRLADDIFLFDDLCPCATIR